MELSPDDAPRSVALYTESPEPSGVGAHMLTLGGALTKRSRVSLAFIDDSRTRPFRERARAMGLTTTALPTRGPEHTPRELFVRAWLRRRRPDVLHVHAGISWESLDVARLARAEGVPTIVRTEHLPFHMPDKNGVQARGAYDAMLGQIDGLVCVSHAVARTYAAAGVAAETLSVAENGVHPPSDTQSRTNARRMLGLNPERPVLLTVARYTDQKGYWQLLDAIPHVLATVPDALFLLVGDGPIRRWIAQAIDRRGLGASVRMLGRRSDVPALMAASDALVLPSWFEGHPLVALEAMFAGLPVAAFDAPGVNEAITSGRTGLLAASGDPEALARAALTLLTDRSAADGLARAARVDAQSRFRAEHMAERTLAIYRRLSPDPAAHRRAAE